MKPFRLSLLGALFAGSSAIAAPVPADLAGSYQALLYTQAEDAGSPAGLITLTVSNKGAVTGKLTNEDNKTYPFKTTLDYTAAAETVPGQPLGTANHQTAITINRAKPLLPLTLNLTFEDLADTDTFTATVKQDTTVLGSAANGFKTKVFAKGETVPGVGAYTVAFELADTPEAGKPAGSGYAIGTVDAKGALKLVGKTGDGTAFTGSFPRGPATQFAVFFNPNKLTNSYFAGEIALTARSDSKLHMLPASTGYDFQWKKAANAKDKSYRDGFGPLDVVVSVEPWTVPAKGQTLGASLGIDTTEVFTVAYDGIFPGSAYTKYIPVKAGLTDKNTLRISVAGAGSTAGTNQDLWAKILVPKFDLKTGKFSATLNIEDTITVSNKPKVIKRKVTFEGVVLQLEADNHSSFLVGQIIVPPLDPKTGTVSSSAFEFQGDITVDAVYAAAVPTAGTYKGVIIRQPNEPEDSQDVMIPYATGTPGPPAGANITFTISPDIQILTFQGRVLKLRNDGRGTNNIITYDDLPDKIGNSCLVHLQIHGTTKRVVGIFATYNQFARSGFSVVTRVSNFLQLDNSIIKQ